MPTQTAGAGKRSTNPPTPVEEVWDIKKAAAYWRVKPSTVRGWINSGKLPHFRTPGGAIRLDKQAVVKFVSS